MAWESRIVGHGEAAPADLVGNPRNWRTHPKAQRDALAGVLDQVGWVQDVIVNKRTGYLVDGHARVAVAAQRGEASVPVVYVDLSEDEELLILATLDPLAAMAEADTEVLADLLASVTSEDAALTSMLDALAKAEGIDTAVEGLTDPDDVPEPVEAPYVQRGEVYQLGRHRLMCGDSTSAEDVARLLDGAKPNLMVTDPPYGMGLDTDWSGAIGAIGAIGHGTRGNVYDRVIGDDKPFDPAPLFEVWPTAKEMFLFGADYYAERIPNRLDGSWLVWDKRKDSQAEAIGSEFELIWSRVGHKRRTLRHDWFGFLSSGNSSEARDRLHPTQKPTSLIVDIIEQWGKGADSISDPYAGSGTTLIAAERQGRTCYAMEIEPKYVQVCIDRWEAFTGLTAERV